jgi:hypothetical protein
MTPHVHEATSARRGARIGLVINVVIVIGIVSVVLLVTIALVLVRPERLRLSAKVARWASLDVEMSSRQRHRR